MHYVIHALGLVRKVYSDYVTLYVIPILDHTFPYIHVELHYDITGQQKTMCAVLTRGMPVIYAIQYVTHHPCK